MGRLTCSWGVFLVSFGLSTAWAAPETSTPPASDARTLSAEGVRHFEAREFGAAAASFAQAWKLTGDESYLWNEALAELNAGQPLVALKHLEECRRTKGLSIAHAAQVEAALRDARSRVTLFEVHAPPHTIIFLDGLPAGTSPLPEAIAAEPNEPHVVSGRLGDGEDVKTVPPLGTVRTIVELAPKSSTPPADRAPTAGVDRKAPSRTAAKAPAPTAEPSSARSLMVLGLGVAALATAGVSVLFAVDAAHQSSRADSLRQQLDAQPGVQPGTSCYGVTTGVCADLADAVRSHSNDKSVAVGTGIAAGALFAGAVATWLLWPAPRTRTSSSWTIDPTVSREGAGIAATARF